MRPACLLVRVQYCSSRWRWRSQYLEAAQRYLDLSYKIPLEEMRLMALSQAVTCAVLAPAGPRRSRLLAIMYKDDRSRNLANYGILEAMWVRSCAIESSNLSRH
jgi:hypothetical protein